jgi:hypothetical protein
MKVVSRVAEFQENRSNFWELLLTGRHMTKMMDGFTFILERKEICLDPIAYTAILKKRKEERRKPWFYCFRLFLSCLLPPFP